MSNDIYKGPLFSDGEGFEIADFNALRDYQQARLFDQVLRHGTGSYGSPTADPDRYGSNNAGDTMLSSVAYTLTGGECSLAVGTANNKVSVRPGTLLAKVAAPDGNAPQVVPYTVAYGEVDLVIADGASNFRVDLLQVKLEWEDGVPVSRDFEDASTRVKSSTTPNTQRRAKATWSIKQGTASATPSFPDPDTGYVAVGAVYVGSSWTSATAIQPFWQDRANGSAFLMQLTMPLGVECHSVFPLEFDYAYATHWARGTDGAAEATVGAATDLRVWCPVGSTCKRIVAIELLGSMVSSDTVKLRNIFYLPGGGLAAAVPVFDLTSIMGHTAANFGKFAHVGQIADACSISNPSVANGAVGDPCWAGGAHSGPAQRYIELGTGGPGYPTEAHTTRAYLEIAGGVGSIVYAVRWWLAG